MTHPRGLSILFFTEMWERFSFYGMRALLVLYLVDAVELPRANALEIYATYTGLVYLTPIVGGFLADRYLGQMRAVMVGGIVMALGHFAMAFPSLLYFALGLIICGNGFFKPNISTLVGSLYETKDMRRDAGFTIFYMGINLGAFLAPLVCGSLGEILGWHYGFAAAGVGMVIGLSVFLYGQKHLRASMRQDDYLLHSMSGQDWIAVIQYVLVTVLLVGMIVLSWGTFAKISDNLPAIIKLLIFTIISLIIAVSLFKARLNRIEFHRVSAVFIVGAFVIFFWMGFEQAGGTMNLFALEQTDRVVLGFEVPASYFQSLNPMFIILLAPFLSGVWTKLDRSKYSLNPIVKQAIGMIILGIGFVVLAIGQEHAAIDGKVSPVWLISVFFLHTLGELCLSPIGLSMVTKLAPAKLLSLLMGVWLTVYAIASYLAGSLESILQGSNIPLYWFLVATSIGAGVVLLAVSPLIKRMMHGLS